MTEIPQKEQLLSQFILVVYSTLLLSASLNRGFIWVINWLIQLIGFTFAVWFRIIALRLIATKCSNKEYHAADTIFSQNQLLWVQWFFLPKISMVLNLVFLFEFERFALNEPFYLPVTEGLQLLSFLVANEIPLLSTILYYELNGIELVLGFTLLTTLLNVLLILGSS